MAISRAQLLKELLPGLNALFGLSYATYDQEHKEIYETETSERSFEDFLVLFAVTSVLHTEQSVQTGEKFFK